MQHKQWLNRQEAAEYLGYAVQTLANKEWDGSGPPCKRISGGKRGGAVRYRFGDLERFLDTSGGFTAQAAANENTARRRGAGR